MGSDIRVDSFGPFFKFQLDFNKATPMLVAQSFTSDWRLACSSPEWTKYEVWTGNWRYASSPPGHCLCAPEQGSEPLSAQGTVLQRPIILTSRHIYEPVCVFITEK